jgi:hypothetical protein
VARILEPPFSAPVCFSDSVSVSGVYKKLYINVEKYVASRWGQGVGGGIHINGEKCEEKKGKRITVKYMLKGLK